MIQLTESGEKVAEMLRPEAEELVKVALSDEAKLTSKDGYAVVMNMLTHMTNNPPEIDEDKRRNIAQVFLVAVERAGYPQDTADSLRGIMGWQ